MPKKAPDFTIVRGPNSPDAPLYVVPTNLMVANAPMTYGTHFVTVNSAGEVLNVYINAYPFRVLPAGQRKDIRDKARAFLDAENIAIVRPDYVRAKPVGNRFHPAGWDKIEGDTPPATTDELVQALAMTPPKPHGYGRRWSAYLRKGDHRAQHGLTHHG